MARAADASIVAEMAAEFDLEALTADAEEVSWGLVRQEAVDRAGAAPRSGCLGNRPGHVSGYRPQVVYSWCQWEIR